MSDPHDREPIDQATIDCWRVNYGLDKRTPAEAAKWWSDNMQGFAPAGCVAALGIALDDMDALRKDADLLAWVLAHPETAAEELEDAAAGEGDARQNLERRRAGIEAARKAEADGSRLLGDA